jgi:hypothetical protein
MMSGAMLSFPRRAPRRLLGAILLAALTACGSAAMDAPALQSPVMVPVSLGRIHGYIATAAALDYDARHWTPTLQDVRVFESGLVDYLRTSRPPEEPDLYRIVPDYKRQYEGLVLDGRRVLFVFFRCPHSGDDDSSWSQHPMAVSDGGKCYFDIRFDIATREYSQLMFNGEA